MAIFQFLSVSSIALIPLALFALVVVYSLGRAIYNLYFHPLAKYPGPILAAASDWPYILIQLGRKSHIWFEELHQKYGDVVRVAPDTLAFYSLQSMIDIYAHTNKSHRHFLKADWYNRGEIEYPDINNAQDPVVHQELRRSLHHAFSNTALKDQGDVVQHYVDDLVHQIQTQGNTPQGMNVEKWMNWLTFDIVGDLTFGSSFDAVAKGKGHPWVDIINSGLVMVTYLDMFRRIPYSKALSWLIVSPSAVEDRKMHLEYSMQKAKERYEMPNDRNDFFGHLLSEKSKSRFDEEHSIPRLQNQGQVLVLAGSETTASSLTGAFVYLLRYPHYLEKLQKEIRSTFADASQITPDSTNNLVFLNCIIKETLRVFIPVPFPMTRFSPGAFVDGRYIPEGTTVFTWFKTLHDSPKYWHRPDQYLPERWLPHDHPEYDHVYDNDRQEASKPFSLGPRVCIGINLAYMEMRLILARLILDFDWELVNKDLEWERDLRLLVLWEKPPVWVRFTPVQRKM